MARLYTGSKNETKIWWLLIYLILLLLGLAAWVVNLFKLIGALGGHDLWSAVVHGIGLIGPSALITVWF